MNICEANGCNKEATKQIMVSVRELGFIDLNLCNGCVSKLSEG
jgi:hypothetical protein